MREDRVARTCTIQLMKGEKGAILGELKLVTKSKLGIITILIIIKP